MDEAGDSLSLSSLNNKPLLSSGGFLLAAVLLAKAGDELMLPLLFHLMTRLVALFAASFLP